jgi:DegV family protein with EDD domain
MAEGATTKTSQVNISEYLEHFSKILEQGRDILHLCLSSGISGTCNSALNAAMIARERFPERKIYVVDSLGASSGYGLLMDTLADLRDGGMEIDELRAWAEANKLRLHHWFFSTDLTFYVRGGRISKTAGMFGGLLGICPLLDMDRLGRLVPRAKIRTKKRVILELVRQMELHAENGPDYAGKCYISHSACDEEARNVADLVEERFPKLNGRVLINNIGTTIGSHSGPGTVALFFWGAERTG